MLEKMLHRKLLKEGEQGKGVVTERHDQGSESGSHGYSTLYEIQGHMTFPDGTETKFKSELLSSQKVGDIQVGSLVPVRYHPSDPSKVVLDVPALEGAKAEERAKDQAWAESQKAEQIAQAEAEAARANAQAHDH